MPTPVWLLLLLLALLPAMRVALKKPVWSEVRARPTTFLVVLAVLVGALAVVAMWSAHQPAVLPVLTVVAIAAAVGAWVRARPRWGRGRGLPPGSLSVADSLDAITYQNFYARRAARWGPVFKMAQFHRPVVCITDLPLGLEVLESQRAKMAQPRLPFGRLSPGNYIEFMNDERHARYRGILRTALSGRVVGECKENVAQAIREQLGSMVSADTGRGIDPRRFLDRLGFVSMLRVMCGVPVDDERLDELEGLFRHLGAPRAFVERRPEERQLPFTRLVDWVRGVGEETLQSIEKGEPLARSALSEILRADARHLDDETVLGNLVLIVLVTRSNVRGLLGWILKEALDHPEYLHSLREAASGPDGGSLARPLATNFVSETLRMHQSEYFYREVIADIEVADFRVPKGWLLRVCVREAHDNPAVFPEPDKFRPERFAGRSYDKTEYCPFSDGAHSCFGAGLAVMIANTFLTELASGFDTRIVADGPVERDGNRHWSHWKPSERLRVSLSER